MDRGPKFWSILIGSIPGLIAAAIMSYAHAPFGLRFLPIILFWFLSFTSITASLWWLLIERNQKLQYIRSTAIIPSVIIIWLLVFTVLDEIQSEGIHVQISGLIDAVGGVFSVVIFSLLATIPLTIGLGLGLMVLRRYLDSSYHIDPGKDPKSVQ